MPRPQYTDAGVYTCSSGQRPYKIPGSYGEARSPRATPSSPCHSSSLTVAAPALLHNGFGFLYTCVLMQVTMSRTPRRTPTGEWSVSSAGAHLVHVCSVNPPAAADVKMDWCNTDINGTQLDPKVQYPQMVRAHMHLMMGKWLCYPPSFLPLPQSKALNNTGKPIFFNACEWGKEDPWEWMAEYANSWRSGPDHHDSWSSTSEIIERNANLGKYAAPGGWNDWDFLMTGGQVRRGRRRAGGCTATLTLPPGMSDPCSRKVVPWADRRGVPQ